MDARAAAITIFIFLLSILSALATNPLPPSRTPGAHGSWSNIAGIPGGIPVRTTNNVVQWTNFPTAVAISQIKSAADSFPSNSLILIGAWTNTTDVLLITTDGITIRGTTNEHGQPLTKLNSNGHGIQFGDCCGWYTTWAAGNLTTHKNWTNGYTQGSHTIWVDNTNGLEPGRLIYMDQLNTEEVTGYSPVQDPLFYVTGEYTSVNRPEQGDDRYQHQVNMIASLSGYQVTLVEPIYSPNWAAAQDPEIHYNSSVSVDSLVHMSGIEDIYVTATGGDVAINWMHTVHCWAKNVVHSEGTTAAKGSILIQHALRPEVRHCHQQEAAGVADRYGIQTRNVAGGLFTDNTMFSHGTMLMVNGVSGSVYSYNYCHTNTDQNSGATYATAGIFTHGGHPYLNLFEGNWAPQWAMDSQWQCANRNTVFRSRHPGKFAHGGNDHNQSIAIFQTNRNMSVIGNILGRPGIDDTLMVVGESYGSPCADGDRVFFLGYRAGGSGGCNGTIANGGYDPQVLATLITAVNWTSATTTNSGIWLNGYIPGDLVDSFYLEARPANWGTNDWPINPVESGATIAATVLPTHFPAAYRMNQSYINGLPGKDPPAAAQGGGGSAPAGVATISGTVRLSDGVTIRQ